jgi:hypothetical protein
MLRALALLSVLAASAPLAAQVPDTAAILAAALRESPTPDSGKVTLLAIRRDTATVTVIFAGDARHSRGHTLTLVLREGRWVVLPRRTFFVRHHDPR